MDAYILDTPVLSAVLDPTHRLHLPAVTAVGDLDSRSTQYVSTVSLGEFWYGVRLAELVGSRRVPDLRRALAKAQQYAVLEVTEHTADAYSDLKSRMAIKYMNKVLGRSRQRWIEDWIDRSTGKKLQIDENDLWQCAQAKDRDCVFITADKGIQRIADADPKLRLCLI